jgi:hypothetical protein
LNWIFIGPMNFKVLHIKATFLRISWFFSVFPCTEVPLSVLILILGIATRSFPSRSHRVSIVYSFPGRS